MRRVLAHFRKQPRESLQYAVDYGPWADSGVSVSSSQVEVSPTTTPPLVVSDQFVEADTTLTFFVSGGVSGNQYQVTVLATMSDNQLVEREILFTVEEI